MKMFVANPLGISNLFQHLADRPDEAEIFARLVTTYVCLQQQLDDACYKELPNTELPDQELPHTELPHTELPGTELLYTELPDPELPNTELLNRELLDTKLPDTELLNAVFPDHVLPRNTDALLEPTRQSYIGRHGAPHTAPPVPRACPALAQLTTHLTAVFAMSSDDEGACDYHGIEKGYDALNTTADTELPDTELPDTELPDTELLNTELPDTELLNTELPDTELPDTKLLDTELPDTKLLDTELPDTELPVTKLLN